LTFTEVSSSILAHAAYSDIQLAPYSQNGFDNSGQRGGIGWGQGDSISRTIEALNKIRDDMGDHPAVSTIELLNEPMGSSIGMDKVRQFYMDGWGNLRNTNLVTTFHDAFAGVNAWNDWGSGMWNLMLDTVSTLRTSSFMVLY
jgi:glucan 1,3-beta-glucosidase